MEAKIATAGEALTASRYRVANFKLGERNTELAGKVKKNLKHYKRCKTCSKPINKRDAVYNCVSCGESMHMTTNCTDLKENAINVLKQLNKNFLLLCNRCVGNNQKDAIINTKHANESTQKNTNNRRRHQRTQGSDD